MSSSSFEVRYNLRGKRASDGVSLLEIRLKFLSRFISHSPFIDLESASAPMAYTLIPFPESQHQIVQLLSSLNLYANACSILTSDIMSLATHPATQFFHFHIVADIDYVQIFCLPPLYPVPTTMIDQDTLIMSSELESESEPEDETPTIKAASKSAIEKLLKTEKLTGLSEDCSICLLPNEKEAVRMPCNHEYHKSCITRWLKINNSCPLCRRPLEV